MPAAPSVRAFQVTPRRGARRSPRWLPLPRHQVAFPARRRLALHDRSFAFESAFVPPSLTGTVEERFRAQPARSAPSRRPSKVARPKVQLPARRRRGTLDRPTLEVRHVAFHSIGRAPSWKSDGSRIDGGLGEREGLQPCIVPGALAPWLRRRAREPKPHRGRGPPCRSDRSRRSHRPWRQRCSSPDRPRPKPWSAMRARRGGPEGVAAPRHGTRLRLARGARAVRGERGERSCATSARSWPCPAQGSPTASMASSRRRFGHAARAPHA